VVSRVTAEGMTRRDPTRTICTPAGSLVHIPVKSPGPARRAELADHAAEHFVLGEQVLLDLHGLVQHGVGVVVGGLGPLVCSGCEHVLADDDDRQEHQLEERLGYPDTSTTGLCELIAEGRLTNASTAKA